MLEQADRDERLAAAAGALDLIEHVNGRIGQVQRDARLRPEIPAFDHRDAQVAGEADAHVRIDAEVLRLLQSVEPHEQIQIVEHGRDGPAPAACRAAAGCAAAAAVCATAGVAAVVTIDMRSRNGVTHKETNVT